MLVLDEAVVLIVVEREDVVGRGAGFISRNCGGDGANLCFGERLNYRSGINSLKDLEGWGP